jgi:Cytochrome b5-like Heme/Steroid binding domain
MSEGLRVISLDECQLHTSNKSCWLIINQKVYDVTEFLEEHPGGYDIILAAAGGDADARHHAVQTVSFVFGCREGCDCGFRGDWTQQRRKGATREVLYWIFQGIIELVATLLS